MPGMEDQYAGQEGLITSADEWVVITPHDTNKLPFLPKAIMVGTTNGNVVMLDKAGTTMTIPFNAGEMKALRPAVITTASTATPIYALR